MPLLRPSELERPTGHNCMAKHGLSLEADFERIVTWIDKCDKEHAHELQTGCSLPFARFVDIKNRCLVEKGLESKFAALSYTWGKCQQFQLKQEWLSELKQPGAIAQIWNDLSKAVTDAIAACERLGIPFLWIDALCIVDDDPNEKHTQISNMDQIYSSAYITLIAAAGNDANAGLPRVTRQIARKRRILSVDNQDYQLANARDWESSEVDKSAWCTRGWTFQELVLSRRVLAFTPTEVFFYCGRGFQAESMHGRSGSNYESRFGATVLRMCNSVKPQPPEKATYSIQSVRHNYETVHWNLLNNYLGRQLSYDTDILDAFSGVLNAEGATIGQSFWGLPCNILARALFWELNNISIIQPGQHYFKSSEYSMVRREGFPSWSWTGWTISKNDMFSSGKKRSMLQSLIDSENFNPLIHLYHIDDMRAITTLMGKRSETQGVEGYDPWQVTNFNHQMSDIKRADRKQYSPLVPDASPHPASFQHVSSHCLIFLASCVTFIVSTRPESRDQDHAYGLYKVYTEDKRHRGNASFPRVWLNIEWRERQPRGLEFVLLGMDVDEVAFGGKGYYAMLIEQKDGGVAERVAVPQPFTLEQWAYGEGRTGWVTLG
ncbi:HET-domain-containing protein [Setomelanomma holmii]|uniref:HET-domain-containing protein n=1 Tax=Setomelanomma holmii TaxID=210430 RepID=A0A9P4HDX4_9PLEO|nr:HET-domain-containing protein [Setomelanomma holmii]